jgi:hypothetical protein
MVIQTVHLALQLARPVHTDLISIEVLPSMDRLDGAIPSHLRGEAHTGMTVGPLSIWLAGATLTTVPTATHERAILNIHTSPPEAIFRI